MSKFDPMEYFRSIEVYKVTGVLVVPPICLAMAHHPGTLLQPYYFNHSAYLPALSCHEVQYEDPEILDLGCCSIERSPREGCSFEIVFGWGRSFSYSR